MRLRAWIRNLFGFSRTETNAFLILLPLMVILIFTEPAYRYWFVRQPQDFSKETKALDSLMATWKWEESDSSFTATKENDSTSKLFSFNPNQATNEQLVQLGFSRSLANRIVNYRLKGGKFLVKKDLQKIYGMDSVLYKKLYRSINLPEAIAKEIHTERFPSKGKPKFEKFDLNKADTAQLKKIYGVGPKLSLRIVTYRAKLGGFVSIGQLNEVYGLDSTVVNELKGKFFLEESFQPQFIDINKATVQELGFHPYLNYKLANAIAAYRFQHGLFCTIDDLKKVALMDELRFQKIKPYLSVNP